MPPLRLLLSLLFFAALSEATDCRIAIRDLGGTQFTFEIKSPQLRDRHLEEMFKVLEGVNQLVSPQLRVPTQQAAKIQPGTSSNHK